MDWTEMTAANVETFGEAVTYTPPTGAATTPSVVIARDQEESEPSEDGLAIVRRVPVLASAADLPGVVRSDAITGKPYLTFDGKNWNIAAIQTPVAGALRLVCYRREVVEKSNRQHRMTR